MTIHKYLNKFFVACAALFWAGCSDDNGVNVSNQELPASSESGSSSQEVSNEDPQSSAAEESSSSNAQPTSSSWGYIPSSTSGKVVDQKGLKRYSDSTVTCDHVLDYDYEGCLGVVLSPDYRDCKWYRQALSKEGYFFADTLKAYKEALLNCGVLAMPEYGCEMGPRKYYECTDGKTYHLAENGMVVTEEEIRDIHMERDGIVTKDPEDGRVFSCAHSDYVSLGSIDEELNRAAYDEIQALLKDESVSEEAKNRLKNLVYRNYEVVIDGYGYFAGGLFKSQTCADGSIVENPEEYQAMYDKIKKHYDDLIAKALGASSEN